MSTARILIADAEKAVNHQIKSHMQREGFLVFSAYSGSEALKIIKEKNPDLIVLDYMLPDMTGVDTCLEIRKTSNMPVLFISHKAEEVDKIVALSIGGDDYITKPFSTGELTARIKAHIRRWRLDGNKVAEQKKRVEEKVYRFPGLAVNTLTREVYVNDIPVYLTAKEFDILALLIESPKRIYSPEQIYEYIWKTSAIGNDARTVMVFISTLRKKIESGPGNPKYVINIRRVGYTFNHHI